MKRSSLQKERVPFPPNFHIRLASFGIYQIDANRINWGIEYQYFLQNNRIVVDSTIDI
jgi:hypothetical protein